MLQTTAVFTNVSKGILAKHEDLTDVFGTQDEEQICIRILNEGDYQARPRTWCMHRHHSSLSTKLWLLHMHLACA